MTKCWRFSERHYMNELKKHFITVERPFKDGCVEMFRQPITGRHIRKAELVITALGLYEAQLNGKKIGDILFAPGFTYYPRNLQFQRFDITSLLTGNDLLTVFLGQGWYCGRFTFKNITQIYGDKPAVSWILTVEDGDGTHRYCSDDTTVHGVQSPYEYAGFYDGEIYHASGFQREVLQPVKFTGAIPERIEEGTMCVRIRETMPVKAVTKRGEATILDFGQNFAGIIEIDPAKMRGNRLKLRHGEILNRDGSLYTANLRKAKAEIVYYKGSSTEKYCPRFTYMGFRYVELSGVDYAEGLITAYAVYSDMERTGYFSCENPLLEKLYQNQIWGQKSNYVEVPTDCPQRDERMGYTGDGQVFAATGAYNFDTKNFWAKFLKDIRDSQMDNAEGYVTPTVPAMPKEQRNAVNMLGWGNCVCIIPELLYWQYGTDRYVREQYESMKRFVELEIRNMGRWKKDLWIGLSLGDWLSMGKSPIYMMMHNNPVSNAFLINDLRIMAWAAQLLGKDDDAKRYSEQHLRSQAAYKKAFIRENGKMKDDFQGAYIMALKMVLQKGPLWDRVFEQLVFKIKKEGMQTGFFATEHILPLLAENGQEGLAFDLLLSEKCPGWLYQVKAGATTTWERWDALRPDGTVNEVNTGGDNMVSFNHYAFGSVGKFYYQYILGIKPAAPGFSKVHIQPFIDARIGAFSGSYLSCYGEIKVAWSPNGTLQIHTPVDAEIVLPNGRIEQVSQGNYQFCINNWQNP